MPATRKAKKGTPPRQERYSSSAAMPQELKGNLVARRCQALASASDRRSVFFLQELSMRDGFAVHRSCTSFPAWPWTSTGPESEPAFERAAREMADQFPSKIDRSKFGTKRLAEQLERFCLDPSFHFSKIEGGAGVLVALEGYRLRFESTVGRAVAKTSLASMVWESLDFALSQRGIVVLEGAYRSGKSFAAQSWTLRHLGEARYISLNSSPDDRSFYVSIAHSLGVARATSYRTPQIRDRVAEVLRQQQLLLILDESQYLFSQASRPKAPPERLNALMTMANNCGSPIVLIASENFSRALAATERHCRSIWGSEQYFGRVRLHKKLPTTLTENDLLAVARVLMPTADDSTLLLAIGNSIRSHGYLGALETVAERAGFFAKQAGRMVTFDDVENAIEESFSAGGPPRSISRAAQAHDFPRGTTADLPQHHRELVAMN